MLDADSEMQDLFFNRQHSEGTGFIAPRNPQCPDSYRVPDNDRRITVQAHFTGPQERRGSIQEHRLQLKLHAETRIKRHSLHIPYYFLVSFTSVSAFRNTQILIGYYSFKNFH